jgi:allophanate hydrolase
MSGGWLAVLRGGAGCTVQDAGRLGHRHEGVARAGWLDPLLAGAANALVGNPPEAAGLEWRGPALVLQVQRGPVRIAVAGAAAGWSATPDESPRPLAPWGSAVLATGTYLHLAALPGGCACLAVSGGVQVAPVLGSRATHGRTRLGGLAGRMLQPGDGFACDRLADGDHIVWRAAAPPAWHDDGPIRVLPGPQHDHFTPAAQAALVAVPWRVTPALDRMGVRLAGPALAHVDAAAADIVSDGVVPGAIQVPADGQPIVLLADCQTVGGYPKIATVIGADLPRLAQVRPGEALRFAVVDGAATRAAAQQVQRRWRAWCAALQRGRPAGWLDEAALGRDNLISGMWRAEP